MCIRDRYQRRVRGSQQGSMATLVDFQGHLKEVNAGYDKIWLLHKDIGEFDVNEQDAKGWSSVHYIGDLCHMPYSEVSKLILNIVTGFQGEINLRDLQGRVPLHWGAMAGNTSFVIALLGDYDELERGEINAQDDKGRTPLHLAAMHGMFETVKILIEFRADPTIVDSRGQTAHDSATHKGIRTYLFLHREKPPAFQEYDEEEPAETQLATVERPVGGGADER
eukprot:TRINITY_DN18318_c0_g1_i3.p1 TRINITY_DN18318_c0_g1~~TRINITY_DN18318_c0_g1_i3.p1  ORF type:complete len:223 (-),score=58.75 TRINITY_DN18318_c0_g1_i3:188-856(-)